MKPDFSCLLCGSNALVKDGGFPVLEFLNIESADLALKQFLSNAGTYNKKYKADYKPGHCNEFSKQSFSRLWKETGFELVHGETYSSSPILTQIYTALNYGNKARVLLRKTA